MELMQANKQWSTRPADENYPSIDALNTAAHDYHQRACEKSRVVLDTLTTIPAGEDVQVVGKGKVPAKLTHWAFGQLARYAGAPADYLRGLPADLASQNLNNGLGKRAVETVVNLLFMLAAEATDLSGATVQAFTSGIYKRVWNDEITERLLGWQAQGWQAATPTFREQGDGKTGLWMSDHDLFAFIVHPDRVIREPGNGAGLLRGQIIINSMVGAAKLSRVSFLFREMCGNHIIWGAEDITETSARHVGDVRNNLELWEGEIARYMDSSGTEDEQRIVKAQSKVIAANREDVLNAMFGKRNLGLSKKVLTAGYDATVPDLDGNPNSYWGLAQGLTRHSQTIPYTDERTTIDIAAGKVINMAF